MCDEQKKQAFARGMGAANQAGQIPGPVFYQGETSESRAYTQMEQEHIERAKRAIDSALDSIQMQRQIIRAVKSGNLAEFLAANSAYLY